MSNKPDNNLAHEVSRGEPQNSGGVAPTATPPTGRRATLVTLAVLAALLCAHVAARSLLGAGLVDDTYIFLRYAQNFADGLGLVFNPGERVEGYTSVLWTLLLALAAFLPVDLPATSMLLSGVAGLATLVALVFYCRERLYRGGWWLIVIPPIILVTNPAFQYWTWSGMDTAIFTLLFFLTFWVFIKQVKGDRLLIGAGLCFFLAAFARLDMLAALPVYLALILYFNWHNRALLWRKYASFLAPALLLALHFVWRYTYYGSWLPNTYYAKAGVPVSVLLEKGLAYTADFLSAFALYLIVALLVLLLIVRFGGGIPDDWKVSLPLIAVWLAYVTYVGGDHFALFRFYMPLLPILSYLYVSAVHAVINLRPALSRQKLALWATFLAVSGMLINFMAYRLHDGQRARTEVLIANEWAEVGLWFKRNMPPDATMASMVVGAIPYYSGLYTYDILGLTDKEIATKGKIAIEGAVGHQKYDTDYILSKKPDYIVYSASGIATEPIDREGKNMSPIYFSGFRKLINDPRTIDLYDFKALRMENGRYVIFLQLK